MKSQDLRPGNAVDFDGQVWLTVKIEHVKPGKGPAYIQAKFKNLQSGNHIEKRLRSSEVIEEVALDRRDMEYLYMDGNGAVFMDCETYDQATVPEDVLGNALDYVKPNTVITGLVYQGNVMSVDLPPVVSLEVTDTPPGIKGATATNQLKEAVCETGLKTRVPPFIANGEIIKINTETGEYLGRDTDK